MIGVNAKQWKACIGELVRAGVLQAKVGARKTYVCAAEPGKLQTAFVSFGLEQPVEISRLFPHSVAGS